LDLSALSQARSIGITFYTTDAGDFGPNTPTYVAIDNLVLVAAVPEPGALVVLGVVALGGTLSRRRKIEIGYAN
jgi:hypothetical protein